MEEKKEGTFKNNKKKVHFNFHFVTVPVCYKIKSYEKILGELQNTCKNEKENKKQLPVQSRVKRLIASRRLNLIKVVHFSSVPACSSLLASSPTDHSVSYFSDLLFSNDDTIRWFDLMSSLYSFHVLVLYLTLERSAKQCTLAKVGSCLHVIIEDHIICIKLQCTVCFSSLLIKIDNVCVIFA